MVRVVPAVCVLVQPVPVIVVAMVIMVVDVAVAVAVAVAVVVTGVFQCQTPEARHRRTLCCPNPRQLVVVALRRQR